jgi:hypothetical protein
VNDTLRNIDPNSIDPVQVKGRQDARSMQVEAQQRAAEIASALRRSVIDLEA